jgi:hypothetical protein
MESRSLFLIDLTINLTTRIISQLKITINVWMTEEYHIDFTSARNMMYMFPIVFQILHNYQFLSTNCSVMFFLGT